VLSGGGKVCCEDGISGDCTLVPTVTSIRPHILDVNIEDASLPATGSVDGNLDIEIHGTNFVDTGYIECCFGHIRVPGTFENAQMIVCTTPSVRCAGGPQDVVVDISLSAQHITSSDVVFTYYDPGDSIRDTFPYFDGFSPTHGPQSGETIVTFRGIYSHVDTGTITCSFGEIRGIEGTYNTFAKTITCISPSQMQPGSVDVAIELIGRQYILNVQFTYYEPKRDITVNAITPMSGPTTGSTRIFVTGDNYLDTKEATCKFTPPGAHFLGLESSAVLDPETGSLICFSPICCYDESEDANIPLTVHVEIALNGQQYTSTGVGAVSFQFYLPPTVTNMRPAYSSFNQRIGTSGSRKIRTTIQGENMVETGEIKCRFGDEGVEMIVPGTWGPPSVVGGQDTIECQCPGPSHKENRLFATYH
jgi:hypothetical protein